ncbi:MAG: Gfo/Idh/MocA family oxidoreductase [Gammaproteobacteria bacterium]|nr:MAG: Gfo/Idh/MocA family oxidoreductase [Gammaproteobacteria bacterium]
MSQLLKVAVVGAGHLGKWHADKYAACADCELVAVVDTNAENAGAIADKHGAEPFADYRDIISMVDAISLVVPTSLHYKIGREFLEAGIHCLIEKPVTETADEAETLIRIAAEQGAVLQVGHIERFNSVMLGITQHLHQPQFIESTRLAPFTLRATDVSVILDLMIHDIDIILDLVDSPIARVSASGISVLSDTIDIANARIEFENHCVANVTASRISRKRERKLRIFQKDAYLSADFQEKILAINRKGETDNPEGYKDISHQELNFEDNDALNLEVLDFVNAIKTGGRPLVDGADGKRALETAIEITSQIKQSL